jgi:effector-binding domain-containing protein
MLDPPQIIQTAPQLTAFIRLTVPRSEIRNVMGPGRAELMAALAAQGIAPTGAWFTHHLRIDSATFDFEICLPVAVPVVPAGRVQSGALPAATVARTIYHGAYERLGAAWGQFDSWVATQGLAPAPDLFECYLSGPESNPDPATWRTELSRPLLSAPQAEPAPGATRQRREESPR